MNPICVVVVGPSVSDVESQIQEASQMADLIELRLDLFDQRNPAWIQSLIVKSSVPILLTLRSQSQGGRYLGSEECRLEEIKSLAKCKPAYFDLECDVPNEFLIELQRDYPSIRWIISHHDFEIKVHALDRIVTHLKEKSKGISNPIYKIALAVDSTINTLQLMLEARKHQNLIFIAMGEVGQISRILPSFFGGMMTYASLKDSLASAPGQISIRSLHDIYHYKSLHAHTALYGLIGDPVDGSISHWTHNQLLESEGIYVKMRIKSDELEVALPLLKAFGFQGISVTMPLKEKIVSLLDEVDSEAQHIGAVNTVHFQNEISKGFNVDGLGALDAIEQHGAVKGKTVVLLGAGGASRAIGFEAKKRGAEVIVLNRTIERAAELANSLGVQYGGLEIISNISYDILINCTSTSMPIDHKYLISSALIMDIKTIPMNTPFLQQAEAASCRLVYGYEMFIRQAAKQFRIWGERSEEEGVLANLQHSSINYFNNDSCI